MNHDRKIQAVIFDMDGVLTDSELLINEAAIRMFREEGLEVKPEDFLPFVGAGEQRYIGGVAEKYHLTMDLKTAKARTYELYLELVPDQLNAFPGATDLVRTCRSNALLVAVASSADDVKVKANLDKIGLPPAYWDAVVTGEEVRNKKPAQDIFIEAAKKLDVFPDECVVVEDAINGVIAAKAAGMSCIAVAHTFPADKLNQADLVREKIALVALTDLTKLTLENQLK